MCLDLWGVNPLFIYQLLIGNKTIDKENSVVDTTLRIPASVFKGGAEVGVEFDTILKVGRPPDLGKVFYCFDVGRLIVTSIKPDGKVGLTLLLDEMAETSS